MKKVFVAMFTDSIGNAVYLVNSQVESEPLTFSTPEDALNEAGQTWGYGNHYIVVEAWVQ